MCEADPTLVKTISRVVGPGQGNKKIYDLRHCTGTERYVDPCFDLDSICGNLGPDMKGFLRLFLDPK